MRRRKTLAVQASGLMTAVGFNSAATCAAIRGGVGGTHESNLWDSGTGKYLFACRVNLPHWWEQDDMLPELVAPAIHQCRVAAQPHPPEHIPLLLGVAAPGRPNRSSYLDHQLLSDVQRKLGAQFHPTSRIIAEGRVSVIVALKEAVTLIETHGVPCCIIAGVDSFLRRSVADHYLEDRRIKSEDNSNGFIPGEAGTAILVAPAKDGDELEILGLSMANEDRPICEGYRRGEGQAVCCNSSAECSGGQSESCCWQGCRAGESGCGSGDGPNA